MTADDAWTILRALQTAIDTRDRSALAALFHDDAVLVGTNADARNREALLAYLDAVVEGDPFRWEYSEVVPFHEDGFAAFGEIVVTGPDGERRAPFRLTLVADGGRIRSFHGSIPYGAELS